MPKLWLLLGRLWSVEGVDSSRVMTLEKESKDFTVDDMRLKGSTLRVVYGIVLVWSGGDVGDKEKNVVCLENHEPDGLQFLLLIPMVDGVLMKVMHSKGKNLPRLIGMCLSLCRFTIDLKRGGKSRALNTFAYGIFGREEHDFTWEVVQPLKWKRPKHHCSQLQIPKARKIIHMELLPACLCKGLENALSVGANTVRPWFELLSCELRSLMKVVNWSAFSRT
ncbi:hypothetical protein ACSQ67_026010 [Phaseolus vulgaris]